MNNLSRHLREAIEINSTRMPLYGALSNNESIAYSKKLIRYEHFALFSARFMDLVGNKYQNKGVPFMEKEFVEMSLTPTFSNQYPSDVDYRPKLKAIDLSLFKCSVKLALKNKDYESFVNECSELIKRLSDQPHVYCMLRHIVESMYQISSWIPKHEEQCEQLGIKPPTFYSRMLLWSHIQLINPANKFDQDVSKIQNRNIPFLFQDLPPIVHFTSV